MTGSPAGVPGTVAARPEEDLNLAVRQIISRAVALSERLFDGLRPLWKGPLQVQNEPQREVS